MQHYAGNLNLVNVTVSYCARLSNHELARAAAGGSWAACSNLCLIATQINHETLRVVCDNMRHIDCLSLDSCQQLTELPDNLPERLTQLRFLYLNECHSLQWLPDLSDMNLCELEIKECRMSVIPRELPPMCLVDV
jgi:hypothetical protein